MNSLISINNNNVASKNKLYDLVQILNDKSLDLDILLKDFDNLLGNLQEIPTTYENWDGNICNGFITTLTEEGIEELKKIYDRLEKIVEG